MKKIKFSHQYDKMLNGRNPTAPTRATLIEILLCRTEELHKRFVGYDTSFFDFKTNKCGTYKLPKGKAIILVLLSADYYNKSDMLWTTIRRYTPQKYEYYKKSRGEEFGIEIQAGL